ncbi:phosphotransferase family protein [Streptomyces sp. NPDC001165]|uniref:phosphotransferase family protein n=1 Tax=Streptomyces sp. NPDC001165 TaxID=3364546 RepID=UPI0036A5A8C0
MVIGFHSPHSVRRCKAPVTTRLLGRSRLMTSVVWSTHSVELRSNSVIKRFRPEGRGACEREWRALTLLAAYAPGLAPVPQSVDCAAEEPVVVMSRVPGEPLRGEPLGDRQLRALAAAASELYAAVPAEVLAEVPVRPGRQHQLITRIHAWVPQVRPRVSDEVGEAMDRGLAWLARSGMERISRPDVPMVFGPGDGNLANYLWDGTRVHVVDFEDSGLSDRPFELAEITEHVASWVGSPLNAETFLDLFDLTAAERARLPECRRLLALVWLFLLSFENAHHPRNPPGTAERQAARLSTLLA